MQKKITLFLVCLCGAQAHLVQSYDERLRKAVANNQLKKFEQLLAEGADIKTGKDACGLLHQIVLGKKYDYLKIFLEKNKDNRDFDINEVNYWGWSPLSIAVKAGDLASTTLLFEHKASCRQIIIMERVTYDYQSIENVYGRPLHIIAGMNGQNEDANKIIAAMTKLLLEHGAGSDLDCKDSQNMTPEKLASSRKNFIFTQEVDNWKKNNK